MSGDEGDFLGRWSARKLKARSEPEPEAVVPPPAPTEAAPAEPGKTDEEILRDLGLPDPETLAKGDDFSAFMKAGVPLRLRNRALRRLWVSDPVLANLDGLNDYEEDFTDAATVVKGMKTAYKVGRGFLRDPEPEPAPDPAAAETAGQGGEAAAAPERGPEAESIPEPGDAADDGASDGQAEGPIAVDAGETGGLGEPADGLAELADDLPMGPRRMRFRFANG